MTQVDARLHLSQLLGSSQGSVLGPLAPLSVAATRATIFHAMDIALGLSPVRALWAQANRAAATRVVTIVDVRRGPVTVAGGAVTIRLGPILRAAASYAHLPAAVTAALPADAGTLTAVQSDQVHTAQIAGRAVRDLARWVEIVIPVLWLAALVLARGRRRRTLAWSGTTGAVAGALLLGARAVLVAPVADVISADPSPRRSIAPAITASLGDLAVGVGIVGLVVGVIARMAGLGAGSSRDRGHAAWRQEDEQRQKRPRDADRRGDRRRGWSDGQRRMPAAACATCHGTAVAIVTLKSGAINAGRGRSRPARLRR